VGYAQVLFLQRAQYNPTLSAIWDCWKDPNGKAIDTCSILTTIPNSDIWLSDGNRAGYTPRHSSFYSMLSAAFVFGNNLSSRESICDNMPSSRSARSR
jgi:hypothetical protein